MSSQFTEESMHVDEITASTSVEVSTCGTEICGEPDARCATERVAAFFVRDLLTAKKCENKDVFRGRYLYTLRGITFDTVIITGTITAIYKSAARAIIVNDGTAEIKCIFEQNKMLMDLLENIKSVQNEIMSNYDADNACDRAAAMLASNIQRHQASEMPPIDRLTFGQRIRLVGRLHLAHEEKHVIYVDRYEVKPVDDTQSGKQYHEEILRLYDIYEAERQGAFNKK